MIGEPGDAFVTVPQRPRHRIIWPASYHVPLNDGGTLFVQWEELEMPRCDGLVRWLMMREAERCL